MDGCEYVDDREGGKGRGVCVCVWERGDIIMIIILNYLLTGKLV